MVLRSLGSISLPPWGILPMRCTSTGDPPRTGELHFLRWGKAGVPTSSPRTLLLRCSTPLLVPAPNTRSRYLPHDTSHRTINHPGLSPCLCARKIRYSFSSGFSQLIASLRVVGGFVVVIKVGWPFSVFLGLVWGVLYFRLYPGTGKNMVPPPVSCGLWQEWLVVRQFGEYIPPFLYVSLASLMCIKSTTMESPNRIRFFT